MKTDSSAANAKTANAKAVMAIEDPACVWREGRLHSELFDDFYFSPDDGLAESTYVFVERSGFMERLRAQPDAALTVGETGFGTGLNFLATWQAWEQHAAPGATLHFVSMEKYPLAAADIQRALARWPELADKLAALLAQYPVRRAGMYRLDFAAARVQLTLCFADVAVALQQLMFRADYWYLDGFSPQHNQGMWSPAVFALLAQSSRIGAGLSTFTAAGFVRRGLAAQGFAVRKVPGFGKKRTMLAATFVGLENAVVESTVATGAQNADGADGIVQTIQQEVSQAAAKTLEPCFALPEITAAARPKTVAIIGGGLAGCSAAYRCALAGMQVVLYEADEIAGAASGNPIGLCAPNLSADAGPFAQFYFAGWQFAQQEFRRLQARQLMQDADNNQDGSSPSPSPNIWYQEVGTQHCLHNAEELRRAQRLIQQTCQIDAWAQLIELSAESSETAEPAMQQAFPSLSIPQAAQLAPRALCAAYLDHPAISRQRVRISDFAFQSATALQSATAQQPLIGHWQLTAADQQALPPADAIIIANAQAARDFAACAAIEVDAVRGQLAYLEQPLRGVKTALQGEVYLSTYWRQQQIIGATFQRDDTQPDLRQADQDFLWQQCRESIGIDLAPQQLRGRVSFRSCGPDRMPVVGALSAVEDFRRDFADLRHGKPPSHYSPPRYLPQAYVSLGHGSRGIVGTLLAAQCIVDQMRGTPLPVSAEVWKAICPQRFLVRALKRGT